VLGHHVVWREGGREGGRGGGGWVGRGGAKGVHTCVRGWGKGQDRQRV
jgi:hypothetical protein